MQKNLKTKLEQMGKEQLLELLEELCNLPDVQKMIKAMVAPSKSDIDRLIQKLSWRCEIYMCNSCNENTRYVSHTIYAAILISAKR